MKIALWMSAAVLAGLWTDTAAVLGQLVQWTAAGLAAGSGAALAATAGVLPLAGSTVGWREPVVWVLWALGLVLLGLAASWRSCCCATATSAAPRSIRRVR
jgi:hypothetical protein